MLDVRDVYKAFDGFQAIAQVFAVFPKLAELRDRKGGLLSGGEQQMLTIARPLMGNPELLLLDEPSEGLAPSSSIACASRSRSSNGMG